VAISTGEAGKGRVNAEINVTPMIDVMLVLLIIFMIVTPLLAAGFQATMPKGKHLDKDPEGEN
jgi:biopolymer transport protein TolR